MGARRRKIQYKQMSLAFSAEGRGEAPTAAGAGTEASAAAREAESPAKATEGLMEQVCRRDNCLKALRAVRRNRGSAGVDGMSVRELPVYLKDHWPQIRRQLLEPGSPMWAGTPVGEML